MLNINKKCKMIAQTLSNNQKQKSDNLSKNQSKSSFEGWISQNGPKHRWNIGKDLCYKPMWQITCRPNKKITVHNCLFIFISYVFFFLWYHILVWIINLYVTKILLKEILAHFKIFNL